MNRMKHIRMAAILAGASSAALLSGATPARAQEAGADSIELDQIVVTARRRAEDQQSVPVAVSAASGAALERLSVKDPSDLGRIAAGFTVTPPVYGSTNLAVTIRSQRQALTNGPYDASTGVYFAEVPQARTQGLNAGFFDLDSVQVLKGPQGTLFGRNTTGGAVIITPREPTREFGGYVRGMVGNFGLRDLEGAINFAIDDSLQIRLAGKTTRRDGYLKAPLNDGRDLDDLNTDSLRLSVRFQPNETFKNNLVVSTFTQGNEAIGYKLYYLNPTARLSQNNPGLIQQLAALQEEDFHTTLTRVPPKGTAAHTVGVSNITTLDIGDVTLKNILGFRHMYNRVDFLIAGVDYQRAYFIGLKESGDQLSNEFNISGKAFDGALDYIAGVFWFQERNNSEQFTENRLASNLPGQLPLIRAVSLAEPTNKSASVYAQTTWRLPTETNLSLTTGIRYTRDEREINWRSQFTDGTPGCRLLGANGAVLNPCYREASVTFKKPTWTVSLDWKPSDDMLVYLAHRRGYRSGGYTFTAYTAIESTPFRPEVVDDFELGLKADWRPFGTVLRTNVAAYYQDYKDIQRNVTFLTATNVATSIINAASAKIKGFEVETTWRLTSDLDISATYAYSKAKYDEFIVNAPGGVRQDYTDSEFAGAPRHTATFVARYRLPLPTDNGDVFAQINGFYQSKTVSLDATTYDLVNRRTYPQSRVKEFTVWDARLEWDKPFDTNLNLSAWVNNVFDNDYLVYIQESSTSATFGYNGSMLGPPRTYGLTARYDF